MKILIKCADVSSPTKEFPIYNQWIKRITQEIYKQGDMEKLLGLSISPFMNREQSSSSQKSFIEFIVYPLFEALEQWTPIPQIKINLDNNREKFCTSKPESNTKLEQPKSSANTKSMFSNVFQSNQQ